MIDKFFQESAERLQIWLHEFQALPQEQRELICIKLLLEVLAVIFAVWLGKKAGRAGKRRSNRHSKSVRKRLQPKQWRTDGRYFDEEKKEWVGPDFK